MGIWSAVSEETYREVTAEQVATRSDGSHQPSLAPAEGSGKEWLRFPAAATEEWSVILVAGLVTKFSLCVSADIRRTRPRRIVPSRHVYRETSGEGVGTSVRAKCRWCVPGQFNPDFVNPSHTEPTPQTFSDH